MLILSNIMCVIVISFVLFFLIFFMLYRLLLRILFLFKYKDIIALFNYYLDQAYSLVYRNYILPYAINGVKISGDEKESCQRIFVKTFFMIIGDHIRSLLLEFYTEDAMVQNILLYFEEHLIKDHLYEVISNKSLSNKNELTILEESNKT